MSQQRGSIQWLLTGVSLLGLCVGVYLVIWKLFLKPDPANSIVKHSVETPSDEVLRYWTANKKRKARPAHMPDVPDLDQEKPHPKTPSDKSHQHNS